MNGRAAMVAAVCGLLLVAGCGAPGGDDGPAGCGTRTSLGAVEGVARGGLCVFRGIPYAAPPTGELRFRPPQPVRPWTGALRATDGSRVCPQVRDSLGEDYPDARPVYADEDCLRLNVWTPEPSPAARRPVLVFIHGGAARFGTGNEPRYDGATLATRGDAVVVTINYRLGVLGWAELGGLDPSYRGSANNGLRDQMAALRWVHEHIADFGGDPGDVTAFGESEGAFSLSAMLATDHPERLFRRVILESGTGYLVHSAASPPPGPPLADLGRLRTMPADELVKLQEKVIERTAPGAAGAVYFGPSVDGTLVRGATLTRVAAGNAKDVDIMLGTNRDEVQFFGQEGPEAMRGLADGYRAAFFPRALAGAWGPMLAAYRAGRSPLDAQLAMFTDQAMRIPATRLAEAQARWRPTYLYEFGWRPPEGVGAIHTAELPFVFGTLRFTGIAGGAEAMRTDRDRLAALSAQMVDAWTSFARTGDPAARRTVARPDWPPYHPPTRATMTWDLHPEVVNDPRRTERELWRKAPLVSLR